ncbi:hypothetical protein EHO65_11265 [Leptospira andrefontaineae]|uniref:Uncharacterized protein n=1 Tax=Leptospira andrefontaineae TaxID=2484976 RepID=A0A4R9H4E4_9LEPT|nr:hypothetical protein EHO65_11265 [Leptospira andrefontaineae]
MRSFLLELPRLGFFPLILFLFLMIQSGLYAQTSPANPPANSKESIAGGPPTFKKLVEEVKVSLKDRGYVVDRKSHFTGSVFKGNTVSFKLQFPEGKDRKIVRKLGVGLAHENPDQSVMVHIFQSDSEDRKLSPLFTGFVEPSFVYEWEARFGENHFLVEIRLDESESNVANFELIFGSQLYTPAAAFGREEKDQNLNQPGSPGKKQPGAEGRLPGTSELNNYFEVFKKEF